MANKKRIKLKISESQGLIIGFAIIALVFVGYLSVELINETPNPTLWDIDYKSKADEISAYGALIGGILSFLSVLFILYNVLEVRGQIQQEKKAKELDERNKSLNLLKLIDTMMISTSSEVISQGERMKDFFESELSRPDIMNEMKWNSNRNFLRLVNLNMDELFLAFQSFSTGEDVNKTLLNIYNLNDYYNDAFAQLKEKYDAHIERKVSDYNALGIELGQLDMNCAKIIDKHNGLYTVGTFEYNWLSIMKEFLLAYRKHIKNKRDDDDFPDFLEIKGIILQSFIDKTEIQARSGGYLLDGLQELCEKAIIIKNKLELVERYNLQYGNEIKSQYNQNFANVSDSFKSYKKMQTEIQALIQRG